MYRVTVASAVVLLAAIAGSAQADLQGFVSITANSSLGTRVWTSTVTPTWDANGECHWTASPWTMTDQGGSGNAVAVIRELELGYIADPVVNLNFAVTAGGADTVFTITSGLLGFAPINAEARATAAITLTESNEDTAALTGGLAGNAVYVANFGALPGGTPFTYLLGNLSVAVPTASATGGPSTVGFLPVGVVSSMQSQFSFTLSANDQASGTSSFVVREVPTPGAGALMAIGGLFMARRRR